MTPKFKLFILFSLLSIFPLILRGQILNIEKSRLDSDSSNFFFISGSFDWQLYNRTAAVDDPIKFFGLGTNLDLAYFSASNSYQWLNKADYFAVNESTFSSFGFSHLRTNFYRKRVLSYELFAQGQYDVLRGLNLRALGGGGIRLRLLDSDKVTLALGLGLMYEHEEWDDPTQERELVKVNAPKSTNYFSFRTALKPFLDLNSIIYYQVGKDDLFKIMRHRINTDVNLNFKLSKLLSFKVSFSTAYENEPIVPITKFIYFISNGIQVNFNR